MSLRSLMLLFAGIVSTGLDANPLVQADWLNQRLNDENLVVLDIQDDKSYQLNHIPGAVNTNYKDWRKEDTNGIPKMMPPITHLEHFIGKLGISNAKHVVIVASGQKARDMAGAARVYWTLKALGHDQVSILDGGLESYIQKGIYPLSTELSKPSPETFFAKPRIDYYPKAEKVKAMMDKGALPVDNRSRSEFLGIYLADEKERPGSLPNAVHLAYDWLTVNGEGKVQSLENIRKIYAASGVPQTGLQVHYCHTGHRASLAWFVSHELLGNKQALLYDGSTAEWAIDWSLPMEQLVDVDF